MEILETEKGMCLMATKRLLILLCAVLLLSLLPTMVLAVDGINDANYLNNPAIKKVRNISVRSTLRRAPAV